MVEKIKIDIENNLNEFRELLIINLLKLVLYLLLLKSNVKRHESAKFITYEILEKWDKQMTNMINSSKFYGIDDDHDVSNILTDNVHKTDCMSEKDEVRKKLENILYDALKNTKYQTKRRFN